MLASELCNRLILIHERAVRLNASLALCDEIRRLILDIIAQGNEHERGSCLGSRLIWSWYGCPARYKNGRKCDKTDCRTCAVRPANTIPVCDWPPEKEQGVKEYPAPSPAEFGPAYCSKCGAAVGAAIAEGYAGRCDNGHNLRADEIQYRQPGPGACRFTGANAEEGDK